MDLKYFKAVDNLTLSHISRLGVDNASDRRNSQLCVSQFQTWNGTEWNHRFNLLLFIPWIWESTFTGNNLFPQRGQILSCKCIITRSESTM